MEPPLVSILIVCYNHERYIKKAIESVINNDYSNIEIIVLDDGSTDNSYAIAKKIMDESHLLCYSVLTQANSGLVKSLNKLISLVSGKYIILLASDDVLTPNSIRDRVAYLEEHSEYDAVIGQSLLIDQNDHIISHDAAKYLYHADNMLLKSKYIVEELVLRWSVVGPCFMASKELYDKIGLYNEQFIVEDRQFYLRILSHNKLKYLDIVVAGYRVHGNNISRNINTSKRIKTECARINIFYSNIFQNIFLNFFLRTYNIDLILLNANCKLIYILFKIFRFSLVYLYLFILRIFVLIKEAKNV
jgi:glycosyltransferase involved in cell wall biosynthesis